MREWDRRDWLLAAAAGLIAATVYALTLAPTVTAEDSGELIAAARTLGVAHPPGYPLWCLLGKAFSLVPVGGVAWRLNLMSSVFAALTVALAYAACRLLSLRRAAAFGGALCLAFSLRFWSQSVIAEVYTLNTALLAGVIVLLLVWGRTRRCGWLPAAAAVFGLSLANHYMLMLLVSPAFAAYVLVTDRGVLRDARTMLLCAALAAGPLVLYLYLPLAGASGEPLFWGDVTGLRGFWDHVSRAEYRRIDFRGGFSLMTKARFMGQFLVLLWRQFTPWVLVPLGLLGIRHLRGRRGALALLGGVLIFNSVVLVLVTQLAWTASDRTRVEEYYLPAYFAASVVIAAGLCRAAGLLQRLPRRAGQIVGLLVCIVVPIAPLLSHWHANDNSSNYLAYDYGMAALGGLERDAVYFAAPDFSAFPAVYLQAVEGVRPDVILADTTGTLSMAARRYLAGIAPGVDPADMDAAQEAIVVRGDRPVLMCPLARPVDLRRFRLDPWGLAFRVQPRALPDPQGAPDPFAAGAVRNIPLDVPAGDLERALAACYHLMRAETLMSRAAFAEAAPRYRRAVELLDGYRSYLNALGAFCGRRHVRRIEELCYRRALAADPDYDLALANLAMLLAMQGRRAEALDLYERLLAAEPANRWAAERAAALSRAVASGPVPTVDERIESVLRELRVRGDDAALLRQLGDLCMLAGDLSEALAAYERAVAADPGYAAAHEGLAVFYEQVVQNRRPAEEHGRRAQGFAAAP